MKNYNSIVAHITINEDNYKAKIINSFENTIKEGFILDKKGDGYNIENEINKCELIINRKKRNFNYYYTFLTKIDYEIVYSFPYLQNSTGFMFYNWKNLKILDLSKFKTEKVINMYGMFSGCKSLTNLNLSNIKTDSVVNMNSMFNECSSLKELNVSSFDTKNVKIWVKCLIDIDL